MSEIFTTPKLPEVKFNKNGYEIRTDILGMAKSLVQEDFHVKFQGWEMTAKRDEKTGQIVSKIDMPEYPGLDKVLETAEKMYSFVNSGVKK
jgi:DNA transposition AAA+ family ATPase